MSIYPDTASVQWKWASGYSNNYQDPWYGTPKSYAYGSWGQSALACSNPAQTCPGTQVYNCWMQAYADGYDVATFSCDLENLPTTGSYCVTQNVTGGSPYLNVGFKGSSGKISQLGYDNRGCPSPSLQAVAYFYSVPLIYQGSFPNNSCQGCTPTWNRLSCSQTSASCDPDDEDVFTVDIPAFDSNGTSHVVVDIDHNWSRSYHPTYYDYQQEIQVQDTSTTICQACAVKFQAQYTIPAPTHWFYAAYPQW